MRTPGDTAVMVVDASSDNRLVRHLNLSLAQLFGRHGPRQAVAVNHASLRSDTNARQQTTGLDCYVNVMLC